jgi:hypothetical protein
MLLRIRISYQPLVVVSDAAADSVAVAVAETVRVCAACATTIAASATLANAAFVPYEHILLIGGGHRNTHGGAIVCLCDGYLCPCALCPCCLMVTIGQRMRAQHQPASSIQQHAASIAGNAAANFLFAQRKKRWPHPPNISWVGLLLLYLWPSSLCSFDLHPTMVDHVSIPLTSNTDDWLVFRECS